ncbi:WecB/TagA/CpsF family glycosyltransferase [Candidatus Clostridium stratigraminis]|uniref:WecB/TagA/CpsF family glycosyltransferase n=1 Tax=Candidatus Clostridium stratigraminis TaxID=3381661 RepID=A0ABW8T131_9CLOT
MEKRIHILGSNVDTLTMDETLARIQSLIKNREHVQHVVINASKINLMQDNKHLADIVNSCPLINADGQSIVWAAKFLGYPIPERVTGIDLFNNLVKLSAENGYRPYFFGAKQEVVEKVVKIFKEQYPSLNIAGYRNGYFKDEESKEIAKDIRESKADILFVAFSSPKKEFWVKEYIPIMQVTFVMGVGGSFDVVAGVTNRAPEWMQKCGLEWFYRFIQEPKRMWKRYLFGNLKFIRLVIQEKFSLVKND